MSTRQEIFAVDFGLWPNFVPANVLAGLLVN